MIMGYVLGMILFIAIVNLIMVLTSCGLGWIIHLILPLNLFEASVISTACLAITAWVVYRCIVGLQNYSITRDLFDEDEEEEEEVIENIISPPIRSAATRFRATGKIKKPR
jgi:hypothetical protein